MKILCFSDIHGDKAFISKLIDKLVERANKDDISAVISAGDFSDFGSNLSFVFKKLGKIKKPVFVIHGNHEMLSDIKEVEKKYKNIINIHGKYKIFEGVLIFGWGGGGFSDVDPSFEKFSKKIVKVLKKHEDSVLVTHAPPKDTKLDKIGKSHVGNKSIKSFIKLYHPSYALSGHIHEAHGAIEKLGETVMVNLGPVGTIIEF
ncbi:metallophosphoesterase [Candidatus Woesearchaeota archaeon]|nr:metallophosphoesterase [Candidatus Woesearchaeota archaeon]